MRNTPTEASASSPITRSKYIVSQDNPLGKSQLPKIPIRTSYKTSNLDVFMLTLENHLTC